MLKNLVHINNKMAARGCTVLICALALCTGLVKCESCLHKKGMVKLDTTASDILMHHSESCDEQQKNFENPVLAYITPWNPAGKAMATLYAKKLEILSPVWHNVILVDRKYHVLAACHRIGKRGRKLRCDICGRTEEFERKPENYAAI